MDNPMIQIKDAVIGILKRTDPDVDVFFEEIKATDESHGLEDPSTYYFLELIPNGSETVDKYFIDEMLVVDIAYHERNEGNTQYWIKAEELDEAFRPVLSFGDRHITIPSISKKIVDHVLHVSFPLSFRRAKEQTESSELMGELDISMKKGV